MELKISERINRFRKDKNLTQEELANALGVSSQAVSNWERGGYPDITLLPVIARFFEVSIDELMGSERLTPEQLHKEFDKLYYDVDDYENRIMISEEYHRKYPNDPYYDLVLGWAIYNADYAVNKNYRGEFRAVIDRLSRSNNPYDVDSARVFRCMVCGDDELDSFMQQLNSPFDDTDHIISYLNNVRMDRARFNGKEDEVKICDQIAYFIDDCEFLDYRCPDEYGPSIKADFLKSQLRFIERASTSGHLLRSTALRSVTMKVPPLSWVHLSTNFSGRRLKSMSSQRSHTPRVGLRYSSPMMLSTWAFTSALSTSVQ